MSEDSGGHEVPTRRDYMKYGGAVVGGGLLAGCAGQSDSGSTPTDNGSEADGDESTEEASSYEVCMKPNGCHTLEEIPETYAVYDPAMIGMMIALGQEDGVVAEQGSGYPTEYLEQLPGVSFDGSNLTALLDDGAPDKELFYQLDVDIHLIDHYTAQGYFEFSEDDVAELEDNIAPFHGSWMRRPQWTDEHPHYDLYEGLNKFAEVFQAEERGQAFEEYYNEMVADITSQLPPVEDRPSVGYLTTSIDESEVIYLRQDAKGYQYKPFRALETHKHDAFEGLYDDAQESFSETTKQGDFELLLEADPDVVIHHNAMASFRDPDTDWFEDILEPLKNDPVAGEVSAYQNDRAYPWHETYAAGPIVMMFETELIAKSIYPDIFGEPTGLEEPPEDEQLFDRQRLADIINDDF